MLACECCKCSNSIESLDLEKSHTKVINKREKLTQAEAKSYKKLRVSSFIPESYFVNGQTMNFSTIDQDNAVERQKEIKKDSQFESTLNIQETKPKLAFQPTTIFEDDTANEAETLIGNRYQMIDEIDKTINEDEKSKKPRELEILEPNEQTYNFDFNLYSIKKNISVWCIDIALLTSNGQTLKYILNKGSHHLEFLFKNQLNANNNLKTVSTGSMTTVSSLSFNETGLIENEERRKFNELWSFYLFMFNIGLVCSSIILQLIVGILLLMNTKSSKKQPSFPRRSGECYNHLILTIILFITIINVFIVIFVDEAK